MAATTDSKVRAGIGRMLGQMRHLCFVLALCACDGSSDSRTDASTDNDAPVIDAPAGLTRFVAYISGGADLAWYDVDKTSGALTAISSTPAFRANANFLAFHGNFLYAVASGNRVGAYAIDPATAGLTFINDVSSGGTGPAHVSVDKAGKFVLVANYGSGHIAAMPVQAGGGLGAGTPVLAGGMAHQIETDPANKFVVVPCLGDNKVAQYVFDAATGSLTPNSVPQLATAAGAGPRHITFAPDGKHAYLINELNSTMQALAYDGTTGRLTSLQTMSTRASGAMGTNTTAEIVVHPNGKFVYGSNRGDNNIVVLARDTTTGMVSLVAHTSTQGMTPRNFTIDPSGKFLYAANQNSGTVVPFAIDPATGRLTPTATPINVPTPAFVGILTLPQ